MEFLEVKGDSMSPTLKPGQIIIASKYEPNLDKPEYNKLIYYKFLDKIVIKRLVGYSGDHIVIQDRKVMVNGCHLFSYPHREKEIIQVYEMTVPEDHIYVIGDNPFNSLDSRKIGPVPVEDILYIAKLRIWPPKFL